MLCLRQSHPPQIYAPFSPYGWWACLLGSMAFLLWLLQLGRKMIGKKKRDIGRARAGGMAATQADSLFAQLSPYAFASSWTPGEETEEDVRPDTNTGDGQTQDAS